jgi:hypothetical protein
LLGIGIEETNAGIGIPASIISFWHRTKEMPDCAGLVRYWIGPGIVIFFHSGTGLIACQTVQSGNPAFINTHTDKRLGQATWTLTWTSSMEMGVHHGHRQAAWILECRNVDEKFSPASLAFH